MWCILNAFQYIESELKILALIKIFFIKPFKKLAFLSM